MECAAILDVLNVLKIIQPPLFDEGKQSGFLVKPGMTRF